MGNPNVASGELIIAYLGEELKPAAQELKHMLRRVCPGWRAMVVAEGNSEEADIYLTTEIISSLPARQRRALSAVLEEPNDAYLLHTFKRKGKRQLLIGANRKRAAYYGIYDYLRRVFGLFYDFHRDLYPKPRKTAHPIPPSLEVVEVSSNAVRSYKPQMLGNYSDLHSPWAWDRKRWQRCIEWCVRQRYNMLHLMLFAQANWIRFDCAPEARDVPDPYMTTEERIAMLQEVIRECHRYGLQVLVGFCTNGTSLAYLRHHPEQQSAGGRSLYQGYLCWHKGHDHLLAVAREYIQAYREADGFVLWPHEAGCTCQHCREGKPFLKSILEIHDYLGEQMPDKECYLLDWHFPTEDFLARYRDRIPAGTRILNVHCDHLLASELALGLPTIHQACVANWDTSSCTVIAPNLAEMTFRVKQWNDRVIGFEAHHVSMFSGEYTIDAFGDLIWDPPSFSEELHRPSYLRAVHGDENLAALEKIYQLLEIAWTSPFHNYTGLPLCDVFDQTLLDREKTDLGGLGYYYQLHDGIVQMRRARIDLMTTANLMLLASAALAEAGHLASGLKSRSRAVQLLKACVEIEFQYARWIDGKFRALLLARQVLDAAGRGDWPQAEQLMEVSLTHFREAGQALDRAGEVVERYPQYFHAIEGISLRGYNCPLSDFGIAQQKKKFFGPPPPPGQRRTMGREGFRILLTRLRRAVGQRRVPDWKALVPQEASKS